MPAAADTGLALKVAFPNAVSSTGAVSPTTRPTPRMIAVVSPERAVGSTTLRVVDHSVAPSASDASRSPLGTSRSTTSAVRVTVGSMSTDNASAAARPLCLM